MQRRIKNRRNGAPLNSPTERRFSVARICPRAKEDRGEGNGRKTSPATFSKSAPLVLAPSFIVACPRARERTRPSTGFSWVSSTCDIVASCHTVIADWAIEMVKRESPGQASRSFGQAHPPPPPHARFLVVVSRHAEVKPRGTSCVTYPYFFFLLPFYSLPLYSATATPGVGLSFRLSRPPTPGTQCALKRASLSGGCRAYA